MPRKSRPLDRSQGVLRDTNIIVVACEDMYAVKQYFSRFRARRTQFLVLQTEDGKSSPGAVIERLHNYRKEYAQEDGDELWVCIDADHWIRGTHQRQLSRVLQDCQRHRYGVAISNPCFEVWLLLHFTEVGDELLRELLGKEASESISPDEVASLCCEPFENQLRKLAGGYRKNRIAVLKLDASQVQQATDRARAGDKTNDRIPKCPGTRVYKLIDALLRRGSIHLDD